MKKCLFLLPLVFLWGCQTTTPPSHGNVAETPPTIRIKDDGSIENKSDLKAYCTQVAETPQTVVVFIHGWHGTVSPPDRNVRAFMEDLEMVRCRTYKKAGRTLTGIAVEWKARTWPSLLEYPAYYFTRRRADKISRADGIAEALTNLANSMRKGTREHMIVAGHSMGARILGRVIRKHPELLKTVDLVLLANTADSVSSFRKTLDSVDQHPYRRRRLPKLVWVTSAHDIVTRIIYPPFNAGVPPGHDHGVITYDVELEQTYKQPPYYSAEIKKVSKHPNHYAHDIRITRGLRGHSDIWNEAMIQILNYYVLRGN